MPSQEDYLDNLLKGIGNTEEEENSRKESEEGVKDETLQDPQIDMSDMDDLLQSALEAQQRDIPETQQSQNTQNSETIHPEETSSMSEDEIDRLLQQSREQAGSKEQQKEPDTNENDDLIKMLENVDDEVFPMCWIRWHRIRKQQKSRKRRRNAASGRASLIGLRKKVEE